MLHMKFGFYWPSDFRRYLKLMTNDGRTTEHGHPISSPFKPSAQVSLNILAIFISKLLKNLYTVRGSFVII